MLKIKKSVISAITEHARRELPYEVCGYLAENNGVVLHHYELTNIDAADDHFNMDPSEQFAAVKDMRGRNLTLRAAYHSHPVTPARPSKEDIRLAFDPNISYVIISLSGDQPIIKSFIIRHGEVQAEEIETVD